MNMTLVIVGVVILSIVWLLTKSSNSTSTQSSGERIAFLNESDPEHPFLDEGEIIETYEPTRSAYDDEMIPLRHLVEPESGMPYVVQQRDILDIL